MAANTTTSSSRGEKNDCLEFGSAELIKAGQHLTAEFQKVEDVWKKAEGLLALAHVPVDVRVKVRSKHIGSEYSPAGCSESFLAYCKQKSGWRICWIEEYEYYNACPERGIEVTCRPVIEWPVEIRLEGFEQFPKLYSEVLKTAKEFVPKIDDAVKEFEKTLAFIDL